MWWDTQNLNKPRKDKSGQRWNFRVWHDHLDGEYSQCVFFWNDNRESCGVVRFSPGVHASRLHRIIEKLVADPAMRVKHQCELRFPLKRYYSARGFQELKLEFW